MILLVFSCFGVIFILVLYIFLAGYKGHESAQNEVEKPQKMDADSESR